MSIPAYLLSAALLFSLQAKAFDTNASSYRDYSNPVKTNTNACGSLCKIDKNYADRIRFEQELSQRGPVQAFITQSSSDRSFKPRGTDTRRMALSFKADSNFTRKVLERKVRWSIMARDVGIGVAEHGRSFTSSLWREIRRPLLHELKDRILSPYRDKKLSTEEKLEAWLIEQSVDSGAGALELEAMGEGGFTSTNMDFGISDYTLKYRPRVDPLRGRYGLRVRYKKYLTASRPFFGEIGFHYCNPSMGLGQKRCAYLQELSARVSIMSMTRRLQWSLFISYRTESLDERAYEVEGERFDHKPWVGGFQLSYAFYR